MPQLMDFLDSDMTFFVITGLAHMHGSDGLLQRLKDSGCKIEKLR